MNTLKVLIFGMPWWWKLSMALFALVEIASIVLFSLGERWALWGITCGYGIFPGIPLIILIVLAIKGKL